MSGFKMLLLAGAILVALGVALSNWGDARERTGYEARAAEDAEAARKLTELRRAQDAVKAREMKEKNDADALEKERLVADRGAALSELDRLRLALRQRRPASPVGGAESPAQDQGGTDGAGADGLLAACAGDFEGVSAEAGRLALKVNNLQEAITIACPACVDGAPIDD